MVPLEVVGPGGSLSSLNVAVAKPNWQDASQRVLAGSNHNGGIQFRLDGNSPRLSAGVAMAERFSF
jgi:hypothetical protein